MLYLELFLSFLLIGFTSFGGMSMIPLINGQMLSHGWMTAQEVADIVAIAEMTPGPLGLNCATFAGSRTAGALGALVYMALYKRKYYPEVTYGVGDMPDSRSSIMREFLRIGIPIAIGASVLSLINLLDNGLCLNRLQSAARFSPQEAHTLYGVYGKAQTLYNLPSYFITPLTLSVVPAITTFLTRRQRLEASEIAESSLRIAAVIAMTAVSLLPWTFRPEGWQVILGAFVVLFSLALCPIFLDLSLFFSPVSWVRIFLPPYWLWLFGG